MLLPALLFVLTAAAPTDARAFLPDHAGEREALSVATGRDGRALSVIGRFDIGLDERTLREPDALADALIAFVNRRPAAFGLSAPYALRLEVTRVAPSGDGRQVAHLEQYSGALRVFDAEITATLERDGALHSLNGALHEVPADATRAAGRAVDEVAQRLRAASPALQGAWTPRLAAGESYTSAGGELLERGLDPRRGVVVWRTVVGHEQLTVDEASLALERRSTDVHVAGTCNVRHADFARDANRRALGMNSDNVSGTAVENPTCEGVSWWPNDCYWQLKLDELGTPFAIARIDDSNGSESEVHLACSSTPSFNSTGGDGLQQQTAYVSIQGMRHFMLDNVWGEVPQDRDDRLHVHFDSAEPATAFFRAALTGPEILVSPSLSGLPDVYWHEYGHYVVFTYDNVSANCDTGVDEGQALNESLANVFGLINALDDPDVRPLYSSIRSFGNGQAPRAHTSSTNLLTLDNCGVADVHDMGVAFEQAVWELLWNRDCQDLSACTGATEFGDDIFRASSHTQEQVLKIVGGALASALKNLGRNITYSQVTAQMRDKIRTDIGSVTAARVGKVLGHHGL